MFGIPILFFSNVLPRFTLRILEFPNQSVISRVIKCYPILSATRHQKLGKNDT